MQKITPFLWFERKGEEAVKYYVSLFKNARIKKLTRHGEPGPAQKGLVMSATFVLDGQTFHAMEGGAQIPFTEAVSMFVNCESQDEVDYFWEALLREGGQAQACGWLKDRYGLSWQIIPSALGEMLEDPDPEKAGRAMQAMLKMKKIEIKTLEDAYAGKG